MLILVGVLTRRRLNEESRKAGSNWLLLSCFPRSLRTAKVAKIAKERLADPWRPWRPWRLVLLGNPPTKVSPPISGWCGVCSSAMRIKEQQ